MSTRITQRVNDAGNRRHADGPVTEPRLIKPISGCPGTLNFVMMPPTFTGRHGPGSQVALVTKIAGVVSLDVVAILATVDVGTFVAHARLARVAIDAMTRETFTVTSSAGWSMTKQCRVSECLLGAGPL